MARGFAAGLIQGTVICGAALVALSLALPQPPRPLQPDPAVRNAAASMPEGGLTGPAAESLSVPAGSEFARGADMQPRAPEPLSDAPRLANAPTVAQPVDESAPETAETERLRPDARGEAPAAPEITLPETAPVDLPAPAGEAPIPVPPPGRVVVPALDRAPERAILQPDSSPRLPTVEKPQAVAEESPAPASAPVTATTPVETVPQALLPQNPADILQAGPESAMPEIGAPESIVPAAPPETELVVVPGLPQPRATATVPASAADPDLSLPPDFGTLRLND